MLAAEFIVYAHKGFQSSGDNRNISRWGNRVYQPRTGLSSKMVWRTEVTPSSVEAKKHCSRRRARKIFLLSGSTWIRWEQYKHWLEETKGKLEKWWRKDDKLWVQFSSVPQLCLTLWHHRLQHAGVPVQHQLPVLAKTHLYWVGNATQSSHPLASPSPDFNLSQHKSIFQFFLSGGQNIGASASVPSMNVQDWFPLGWTGWISLQSNGLSRVFSSTTVQKHHIDFKWKLTTIEKVINWECEGRNLSHTLPLPSHVAQGLLLL